jgi:uncharacterized protein (TIGR02246 family)
MRRVMLPLMLVAVGCHPRVVPLTDEDLAALDALRADYVAGILAGDAATAAAVFAEDALWLHPYAPAVEGRAAIRATYEPEPGVTVHDFTITSLAVDGYGDLAFDRGAYSETVVIEGVAEAITVTGKYVVIARKEADGSWRWTVAMVNHDAPLPQMK